MHRTFTVRRRFHPAYSLLGRGLRRLTGDARRAEALYLVALSGLVLALVLASTLAWALLYPTVTATPRGPVAAAFWAFQLGGLVVVFLAAVVGFAPAVTATIGPNGLHLRQGDHSLALSFDAIRRIESLDPLLFHRHYARYTATHVFVNRLLPDLLLLDTTRGPVVVGLTPDDLATLRHALTARRRTPAYAAMPAA